MQLSFLYSLASTDHLKSGLSTVQHLQDGQEVHGASLGYITKSTSWKHLDNCIVCTLEKKPVNSHITMTCNVILIPQITLKLYILHSIIH